jgi:hypothetical protein
MYWVLYSEAKLEIGVDFALYQHQNDDGVLKVYFV